VVSKCRYLEWLSGKGTATAVYHPSYPAWSKVSVHQIADTFYTYSAVPAWHPQLPWVRTSTDQLSSFVIEPGRTWPLKIDQGWVYQLLITVLRRHIAVKGHTRYPYRSVRVLVQHYLRLHYVYAVPSGILWGFYQRGKPSNWNSYKRPCLSWSLMHLLRDTARVYLQVQASIPTITAACYWAPTRLKRWARCQLRVI
jgi:hypothetical protein